MAKPQQIALPLAGESRPWFNVEPDVRPGDWRVVDSKTGEVMIDRVTRGRAWAWVSKRKA